MNVLDFVVLASTLLFIVAYGIWKTRGQNSIEHYLRGDNTLKWGTIGLSVMATQASAITFISTPGQAYESGMGFVQNYFGLPIALLIVAVVFIPIYYKLKVFTAYEFLETRFDLKTRLLGAFLFLIQRGLAAGITIYAPSIILSSILGWDLSLTILFTGVLVIVYTVSGGTKAVSVTQKQQMAVIMGGMFLAFFVLVKLISDYVPLGEAYNLASLLDKTQSIDFSFNLEKRYTFWSGITGGLFLQLSYFGTDQSQVQRYLGGKDSRESRLGLMFNAVFKIPMQYFILFIGVMMYVFYVFYAPPVHFKQESIEYLKANGKADEVALLESQYSEVIEKRKSAALAVASSENSDREIKEREFIQANQDAESIRQKAKDLIVSEMPDARSKDSDFVFLTFILNYLPHGIVGLLIAVILSAAMSSTSSEVSALASTTAIDFYKRVINVNGNEKHYLMMSKVLTMGWGLLAIFFAFIAQNSENLIEAVNIVGSIFYGTILGIFLVAFFFKYIKGTAVFWSAILAQGVVIALHFLTVAEVIELGYLWYNAVGCFLTILFGFMIQFLSRNNTAPTE